jgi:hypothetical protein
MAGSARPRFAQRPRRPYVARDGGVSMFHEKVSAFESVALNGGRL